MVSVFLVNIQTALRSWNLKDGREQLLELSGKWDSLQK
jgi:hypothetical protein